MLRDQGADLLRRDIRGSGNVVLFDAAVGPDDLEMQRRFRSRGGVEVTHRRLRDSPMSDILCSTSAAAALAFASAASTAGSSTPGGGSISAALAATVPVPTPAPRNTGLASMG